MVGDYWAMNIMIGIAEQNVHEFSSQNIYIVIFRRMIVLRRYILEDIRNKGASSRHTSPKKSMLTSTTNSTCYSNVEHKPCILVSCPTRFSWSC